MSSVLLTASRKYPTIPTIDGSLESHTKALEVIRDAVQTHERRTGDKLSSFIRVKDLIDLGLARLVGSNRLELTFTPGSGSGTGVALLDDLDDVDTAGVQDGDALVYDATYGLWLPEALNIPAVLSDLDDVNTAGAQEGDSLVYDATYGLWLPEALNTPNVLNDLDDVNTAGVQDGDVLTYDTTYGSWMPEAPSAGSSGAMVLVGTATVAGAAATTLVFSGLDLDAHGSYAIDLSTLNATSTDASVRMYMNADTTDGNYDNQIAVASNTVFSGGRLNTARITTLGPATNAPGAYRIWLYRGADAKVTARLSGVRDATTAIITVDTAWRWRTASTNVTSITFSSATANALAIGTYARIWKLATT